MRRAQSTIEVIALIGGLVGFALLVVGASSGRAADVVERIEEALPGHRPERRDDRWALRSPTYGPLLRRYAPTLVLERDRWRKDRAVPVDPAVCRRPACAALDVAYPVAHVHVARRDGVAYLQYWFFYPDSQTSHIPVRALRGHHRDDWEGLIVRIDPDDGSASARVTSHAGVTGSAPWWALDPGWQPVGPNPVVYRASGSHAGGFRERDIDLARDRWNGTLATIPSSLLRLVPADTAPGLRLRYDPAVTPPWRKRLWTHPAALGTGASGERGDAARAARAWASAVQP